MRDFEPQGVALVFSEETTINMHGLTDYLRGYINTKGEEIIPLEYSDRPDCGASYIYPIHREIDGMIELYKDGYYHYFSYDGTLLEKTQEPRPQYNNSLTYKFVEPSQEELGEMPEKLWRIAATFFKEYDCNSDNAYSKLIERNELYVDYIPEYYKEVAQYVSEPIYGLDGDTAMPWSEVVREKDPLGRFGEVPPEVFDENGVFDEQLYYDYCEATNQLLVIAGYNKYDGAFMDWLIGGVWNGKVDHDTYFEFADGTMLYYHDGNYLTRRTEGGRGGECFSVLKYMM